MDMSIAADLQADISLEKIARTATATGASVDNGRDGYARMAQFDLGVWTDGTHHFSFEESKLGSIWVVLPARQLSSKEVALAGPDSNEIRVVDDTLDNTIVQVDMLNVERFIRIVDTIAGASSCAVAGVMFFLANQRHAGTDGQPAKLFERTDPTV